ncbi:MAG: alpha/beta hydrolase [Sedimentisphaerales bacterium]|nr:alpha/beta hydrolase [Sedimentisphaerales bacterium]
MKPFFIILITLGLFVLASCQDAALLQAEWNNAVSKDDTVIAYSTQGTGDVTLVFIHGLSCDSRYWQKQIPYFSKKYQVVTIDLAGHGHSGLRTKYTMGDFGNDVVAVVEKINAQKIVLIGHSMGGAIILEAAKKMPDKVVGVIGIDTLHNFEEDITEAQKAELIEPMKADFRKGLGRFARQMFPDNADKNLVDWVAKDMSSGPKDVAISSVQEYLNYNTKESVKNISCPIICVNADLWPTNVEVNKRCVPSYKLYLIKNAGHFLMLEKPDEFNRTLDSALAELLNR